MTKTSEITEFVRDALKSIAREKPVLKPVNVVKLGQFHDDDYWYLLDPIGWKPNADTPKRYKAVNVPKGFVTDLTSAPRAFWSLVPRTGVYLHAAIVHDFLYWEQAISREDADEIFNFAMTDLKVGDMIRSTIYSAVKLAGGASWNANNQAKLEGEKRVLKDFPDDPMTTWTDWKKVSSRFA